MVDGMMSGSSPFGMGGHSHPGHHPGHPHPGSHMHHPSVQDSLSRMTSMANSISPPHSHTSPTLSKFLSGPFPTVFQCRNDILV